MDATLQVASYRLAAAGLPLALGGVATAIVSLYVAVMRGSAAVRSALILLTASWTVFFVAGALAISAHRADMARQLYRIAVAPVPLAGAGLLLLALILVRRWVHGRGWVAIALAGSAVVAAVAGATDWVVGDVWMADRGSYWFSFAPLGAAYVVTALVWPIAAVSMVLRQSSRQTTPRRARQLRRAAAIFALFALPAVDFSQGYGAEHILVSWLLIPVAALLTVRLVLAADVNVRHPAPEALLSFLYLIGAVLGVWLVHRSLAAHLPVDLLTALVAALFIALRIAVALAEVLWPPPSEREGNTPLARAAAHYAASIQDLRREREIGKATTEVLDLGLGSRSINLFLPCEGDYSWMTLDGQVLEEQATPNPLLLGWFLEHTGPLQRLELETKRLGDLRELMQRLFAAHDAHVLAPLVNRDQALGLIALGALPEERGLRSEERGFLEQVQKHAADAFVYARMQREAMERVELDQQVALAAAVQGAFVPGSEILHHGRVAIAGRYQPASRCGGDWWSVHQLSSGRVLVLIGDVTGHGVAPAMVTAAAKGCYDVAHQLMGDRLDLARLLHFLDAAVRRAGGGEFFMTCFATLLDPEGRRATFVNAGHLVPYLCRLCDGRVELDALVARGNPLGIGESSHYHPHQKDLLAGDILVWYTDGLIECNNLQERQFGDRRLQRMLRGLHGSQLQPELIRDQILAATFAFREGQPATDDLTLVVAKVETSE